MDFEDIIRSARFNYKQLVDADDWTPGPGYTTPAAEPTLTDRYQADLPTDPMGFQTIMCQAIYPAGAAAMSASTQATPSPPKSSSGRVGRCG